MIHTAAECRDFARLLESRRREGRYSEAMDDFRALRQNGEINDGFSLATLFESVVPDGREALHVIRENRRTGTGVFMEAGGDAVQTTDFSNIIGQIAYADTMERLDRPDMIAGKLIRERPAATSQLEIVPSITMIGDRGQNIGENEEYPEVKLGEQWIVVPEILKNGFQVGVTEEALAEDKTGQLMDMVHEAIDWLAIGQEKERLRTILGITTSFRWKNEAAQATYGNSFTGFTLDNLLSNSLVDYTSIDTVKNSFADTTDPNTGEPVVINGAMDIIVPHNLETRLGIVLNATGVVQGAITADVPRQMSQNPLNFGPNSYPMHSSPYVSSLVDGTTWWAGKFSEAFEDRVVYPLQTLVADRNHSKVFDRDWVTLVKVRRKSAPGVRSPWKVRKCT